MRRGAHRLVVWLSAVAAALILIAGAGLWRLTQGPIDLDLLTPYLQEALNRSAGGLQITVSGVRLGINRDTSQLDMWIAGLRITQPDGEPLAAFSSISADFSLRSLLRGRMEPTRLIVERPLLRVIRDKAGAIQIRFSDQENEASSIGPEIFEQLAGPPNPEAFFGLMRRAVVRNATLIFDDRQTGRRWRANRIDAAVERDSQGLTGDLSLALPIAAREPELHASYRYLASEHALDITLEVGALELAALASTRTSRAGKFPGHWNVSHPAEASRANERGPASRRLFREGFDQKRLASGRISGPAGGDPPGRLRAGDW